MECPFCEYELTIKRLKEMAKKYLTKKELKEIIFDDDWTPLKNK